MTTSRLYGFVLAIAWVGACSGTDETSATAGGGHAGSDAASDVESDASSGGVGGKDSSLGSGGDAGSAGVADAAGAGGTTTFNCSPAVGSPPLLKLTQLVTGISGGVLVEAPPGDTERLFILGQTGAIRIFKDGSLASGSFLDITAKVKSGGEQGLLGLAFHPQYAQNGRFFVHYTANGVSAPINNAVISEFKRSVSDPETADAQEKVLLTFQDPYANHNGGAMHFRDGMLFIGLGDGGSGGDPLDSGQSLDTFLGKILRIDVDNPPAGMPYGIPAGNITGSDVFPEIWNYGLRNPWRWSFDACTGDMYIPDVGQGQWEEVDVEPYGTASGKNYGWRVMEGAHCYSPSVGCDQSGKVLPVAEYDHTKGCSITGGYVYRGSKIPGLRGWYLYADFCSGRFWMLRYANGVAEDLQEITDTINPNAQLTSIVSFGQDGNGELYVLSYYGGSRVFRIDAQ